jgi:hypothetical protein
LRQGQRSKSTSAYWVSFHLEMVGAQLLGSQPVVGTLEHFLQELHQLVGIYVVTRLPGPVLNSAVLPSGMYLLLQWCHSVGQPVGGHVDSNQVNFFNSLTRLARADTMAILESVGSSTQVASYSGRRPTKGGRLGS